MLKDEDIQLVKSSITMRQVAGMYGYQVNRAGFMKCPFHPDHSPSLKVYDGSRGFNCFVCHTGGDVIRFVMKHDGIGFEQAVRLLAEHFGIPVTEGKTSLSEKDRERLRKRQEEKNAAVKAIMTCQARLKDISNEIHDLRKKQSQFKPLGPVWCWMQRVIEKLESEWEWWFEEYGKMKGE